MARLGRGRRSKPIYLRGKSVVTSTPLVRKRIVVELQTINRFKYYRIRNSRHLRYIRAPMPKLAPWVRPKIVVEKTTINRARYLNRRNGHKPIIMKARSVPTFNWVRPKIVVEKVTINRGNYLVKRNRHHPIILRAPMPLLAGPRIHQPIIVSNRKAALIRGHRHRQALILRGVSTPTFKPRLFKPIVITRKRRSADVRARYRHPYIFFPRGGSIPIIPPPDTVHHETLFLTRFGYYV